MPRWLFRQAGSDLPIKINLYFAQKPLAAQIGDSIAAEHTHYLANQSLTTKNIDIKMRYLGLFLAIPCHYIKLTPV